MAVENPFPFASLISRASPRWFKWTSNLVLGMRSLSVRVPEDGQIVASYDPTGTVLEIPRSIPLIGWCRVGAGGIPARDGTTGELSEAEVTLYYREIDPDTGTKYLKLGTETDILVNEMSIPVPANVDALYVEEGGELTVLGWVCPD